MLRDALKKHANLLVIIAIAAVYALANPGVFTRSVVLIFLLCSAAYIAASAIRQRQRPFSRLSPDELARAIAIIRSLKPENSRNTDLAWLSAMLEKHGSGKSFEERADQFNRFVIAQPLDKINDVLKRKIERSGHVHDGPALVLARKARAIGFDVVRDGSSWFGGFPALGKQEWPCDTNGQLLTPICQIDLSEVNTHITLPGLPHKGSLAFFVGFDEIGVSEGAVRFIEEATAETTQPPEPLSIIPNFSHGGTLSNAEPREHQTVFPRAAIEMAGIPYYVGEGKAEFRKQVSKIYGPAAGYGSLRAVDLFNLSPDGVPTLNRDSLLRFTYIAKRSLMANAISALKRRLEQNHVRLQETLAKKEESLRWHESQAGQDKSEKSEDSELGQEQTPDAAERAKAALLAVHNAVEITRAAIERSSDEIANLDSDTAQRLANLANIHAWASRGSRWAALTSKEKSEIAPLLASWKSDPSLVEGLEESIRVMAISEGPVFSCLPEEIRAMVEGQFRQPPEDTYHQMFGEPQDLGASAEYPEAYLLLQLASDDLAGFFWGETGFVAFWIDPQDLQAGAWDKAFVSFAMH